MNLSNSEAFVQEDVESMVAGPSLSDAFRRAFRHHPAGVAVLTARVAEQPLAITISSLISVSAAPPVVGFSLSSNSSTASALLRADSIVIHLLRHADKALAELGAAPGRERFGPDTPWEWLPTGEPRYTQVATWFRAELTGTLPVEGATIVVARLLEGVAGEHTASTVAESLIYLDRRWHRLHQENSELDDGHCSIDSGHHSY